MLIVDDDESAASQLSDALIDAGFAAEAALSGEDCLARMRTDCFEIVVTDIQMNGMSGLELCSALRATYPNTIVMIMTGYGSLDTAIGAIRAEAYDFLLKPVRCEALAIAVARASDTISLRDELRQLRETAVDDRAWSGIAGRSESTRELIAMIERVANSDAPVLIHGESGTGKELVARALHHRSGRSAHPFVAINCAAMPAPLLESELFGHVRGSFTDAKQSRAGLLVRAGVGTIMLDEIGEMPIELQAKLLRALQERRVRPVGGDAEIAIQARIVAATNRDLESAVAARRFREDLFYRINVLSIGVPPLRERNDDVLLLAHVFLDRIAKRTKKPVRRISLPAARALLEHDWPGNVRELENCMERAVALCRLDEVTLDDLPATITHQPASIVMPTNPAELVTIDEMGRRYVRWALQAIGGNKARLARILGIDRRSVYRRLEQPEPASEL